MTSKTALPVAGLILAAATAVGLVLAGTSLWLSLGVLAIWSSSLLIGRVEPETGTAAIDQRHDVHDTMRGLIEPVGVPLVLFDRERILGANAAARATLGGHIIGQDPRIALRHPDAVRLLDLPDDGSVTIRGLTGPKSLWQLTRRRIDDRYWIIELMDRTTEADISRAHTDFVANASHELRTPLAAVIGYIETLADAPGKVDVETTARFHATVLRESRRMQHLVSDLMSLSQLEADKHDAPRDAIELGHLTARVVGEFSATQAHSRLELSRPDAELLVTGDSKQLEQLVRNLIDNALKYGDDDKPVSIDLTIAGSHAALAVTDRGPGVAAEHLPHLTRRFYRTDPGRSRAAGGTGLGLAIVKHIVERHRGKLDIGSVEGTGTTVTVRLPINVSSRAAMS